MKKTLLLFSIILLVSYANAQKLIAVQNAGTPNFYEDVNEAFDSAIEGDTLYFPGGSFNLDRTIDKTLHIIGVGHNPNSTSATGSTLFACENDNPQLTYETGGGGSVIGVAFSVCNASGNIVVNSDINGLVIDRVNLPIGFHCNSGVVNNLLMVRSIVNQLDIREKNGVLPSGLISNNIIKDRDNYLTNLQIEHNNFLFVGSPFVSFDNIIAYYCSISNNIFEWAAYSEYDADFCSFRNNFGFVQNGFVSQNHFSGNFTVSDLDFELIFINFSSIDEYDFDLNLIDNSPLLNSATDGGQIGIYGGRFPWKERSVPFNPHIVSKNISGSTDDNGNLPIQIEVQAQEN